MSRSRPRSRSSPVAGAVAAAVVVLAVAVACSGGGDAGSRTGTGEAAAAADDDRTTLPPLTTAAPTTTAPTTPPPASGADPDPDPDACAEVGTWGTDARGAGTMAVEDVHLVRPGRHDCYDRVVVDVNGVVEGPDSVGFHVAYADGAVAADGSGEPVPTAGGAALEVVVRAPALGYGTSGHQPGRRLARLGDDLVTTADVAGWPALREVTFAGSFEGQTTFAVGVDSELPFRAGSFESDGCTRVYVDIAHP